MQQIPKDLWIVILNEGIIPVGNVIAGLKQVTKMREVCKAWYRALSKIDFVVGDQLQFHTLRDAIRFRSSFPKLKCGFSVTPYKNGDPYGHIYLDDQLTILTIDVNQDSVVPFDTGIGNEYTEPEIIEFGSKIVYRSNHWVQTLQWLFKLGVPEGIDGFLYHSCQLSNSHPEGIETVLILLDNQLNFEKVIFGYKEIQFTNAPEAHFIDDDSD